MTTHPAPTSPKFATAIINWPPSTFNLKTMAKLFAAALPKPCQQALQTYFDVYNTLRTGSRLLSTIEPWNLYMAVTVLESILAYNKTQASALIASGFISHAVPPTTQRKSASPVMTITTSAPTKPVSYAHHFQHNASSAVPASLPSSQPPPTPAVSSTSPTGHASNKRSQHHLSTTWVEGSSPAHPIPGHHAGGVGSVDQTEVLRRTKSHFKYFYYASCAVNDVPAGGRTRNKNRGEQATRQRNQSRSCIMKS